MIDVYCDESNHLENDGINVMIIGGILVPHAFRKEVYEQIKQIKLRHDIPSHREIKWTKVSQAKLDYYEELIRFFFESEALRFRAVVIPDKSTLTHELYNQTHDDFYYKMYYLMLRKLLEFNERINVYIDIKDTNGQEKVDGLKFYLNRYAEGTGGERFQKIQQIRSHENSILQLADLLIGAIGYKNRGLTANRTKVQLADLVHRLSNNGITRTSFYNENKFNLLFWEGR